MKFELEQYKNKKTKLKKTDKTKHKLNRSDLKSFRFCIFYSTDAWHMKNGTTRTSHENCFICCFNVSVFISESVCADTSSIEY